jgi:hypothetical protein
MQALREIRTAETDTLYVNVPKSFMHRKLEIIVIPVDEMMSIAWPAAFFEQTAGSFAANPLVREEQGNYEVRNDIV